MKKLEIEELELLQVYEAGTLKQAAYSEAMLGRYKEYAKNTFQKDARINIRLSARDSRLIQKRALERVMNSTASDVDLLDGQTQGVPDGCFG